MSVKLTTEVFIERARLIHGDRYSYDKVIYNGAKNKVIIGCKIHGDFEQNPFSHINGNNCIKCSGKNLHNNLSFIDKCKLIHGNKYNYDKINYINNSTKVIITCLYHGDFLQTPNAHLRGSGCYLCFGTNKISNKEFIEKSKMVHGNKYIYDKIDYVNSKNKIVITCPKHGDFIQSPANHLSGQNCPKCSGYQKLTSEDFIKKCKEKHGEKYDYSKVKYISLHDKVTIICKIHGDFYQLANTHIRGSSCPQCIGLIKSNTHDFIKKAIKIHGDKYNYDNVEYINSTTKIKIKCYKHGFFEQTPSSHISSQGCPFCKISKGELKIKKYFDENNIKYKTQFFFDDLKYINHLRFDFCVLDNLENIKYLIEFNGKQHYNFYKWFHKTEDEYRLNQYRDKLKMEYCIKNNIPLHIIKYNQNIETELSKIIFLY